MMESLHIEQDSPYCARCGEPCGKGLGGQTEKKYTFWGGSEHGSKVFYRDRRTSYFCTEVCRTEFFYGDALAGGAETEEVLPGE